MLIKPNISINIQTSLTGDTRYAENYLGREALSFNFGLSMVAPSSE